jgi:hypothetical protein
MVVSPIETPPSPPVMTRAADAADDDAALLSRPLLELEKAFREERTGTGADRDDAPTPHAGYGSDPDEPAPPQAYVNRLRDDRACACWTSPLANVLCVVASPVGTHFAVGRRAAPSRRRYRTRTDTSPRLTLLRSVDPR